MVTEGQATRPPGSNDQPWTGTIKDVRIYDRVLTNEEIQQLATGRGGNEEPPCLFIHINGKTIKTYILCQYENKS